jgi:hypothetical protein
MIKNDTTPCAFDGCWNRLNFRDTGLCQSHQIQYRKGGTLRPIQSRGVNGPRPLCGHEGCQAYARTRGWCKSHYMKWLRTGETYGPGSGTHCKFDGCNRAVDVRGYCERHYKSVRDSGAAPWTEDRTYPCRVFRCERTGQNGMCNKHSGRAQRFGLTWDELAYLMRNGTCEACGFDGEGKDLHIHHDHSCCPQAGRSCGKCVVAYLCSGCNTAAGMCRDDAERMRKVADVISRPPMFKRD